MAVTSVCSYSILTLAALFLPKVGEATGGATGTSTTGSGAGAGSPFFFLSLFLTGGGAWATWIGGLPFGFDSPFFFFLDLAATEFSALIEVTLGGGKLSTCLLLFLTFYSFYLELTFKFATYFKGSGEAWTSATTNGAFYCALKIL